MLTVVVGCDAYPGGIKNIGLSTVANQLEQDKDVDHFLHWINENAPDGVHISTLMQVLIYEPACLHGQAPTKEDYLFDPPTILPNYLKEFAAPKVMLIAGPPTVECSGFGEGVHCFFQCEGVHICSDCNRTFCHFCVFQKPETVCLECYLATYMTPGVSPLSQEQMRQDIVAKGVHLSAMVNIPDIQDLHDLIVIYDSLGMHLGEIDFPALRWDETMDPTKVKERTFIDLSEGGIFIFHPDLTPSEQLELLKLLGSLVTYSTS